MKVSRNPHRHEIGSRKASPAGASGRRPVPPEERRIAVNRALVLLSIVLVALPAAASASIRVEADLDGIVGNGTDYIVAYAGEPLRVDLWIVGDAPAAWVVGLLFCNPDHHMALTDCEYFSPGGGWSFIPPPPPEPVLNCWTVQGQNFAFDVPMAWPWKLATLTFDCWGSWDWAELFLGAESGIQTIEFEVIPFDNDEEVIGYVQIAGGDAVEPSTWSGVKSLFR